MTESAPASSPAPPPPRSGLGLGCKIALGILALLMLGVVVSVVSVVNALSWFQPVAQPAVYPAAEPTPQQRMELGALRLKHVQAYEKGTELDVVVPFSLINVILAEETKKGKMGKEGRVVGAEWAHEGDTCVIRFTVQNPENKYLNVELRGDPHIENGQFKGRLDSIRLNGKEPPWLARLFVNSIVQAAQAGNLESTGASGAKKDAFEDLKLVRREDDKLRLIFHEGHVPDPHKDKPEE